ncbi:MAG: Fic family protein, partial [Paludibacteraceae bacterium]|nr:Fic family protein [Paludibacteraceae bacterium]
MKVEPTLNPQKQVEAIQMLTDQQMQPLFQKISSEYLYWDKVKYMAPKGIDKQVFWQAVKIQR